MLATRFSLAIGLALVLGGAAGAELPKPAPSGLQLAQIVRETPLDDMPAVDRDRAFGREREAPAARTGPPPPPPVPPAPKVTTRAAPPPDDTERGPPVRSVPPPPGGDPAARAAPPQPQHRVTAPPPQYRVVAPPPPPDRPPPRRSERGSSFAANCTQQCHLTCEASFEACNGDSSPATPACVRKLEACRTERCACRLD